MRFPVKTVATLLFALMILTGCTDSESPTTLGESAPSTIDSRPPVIVIGVDGAEWDVIKAMVDNGQLPGFARLIEEGAFAHLLNVGPQVSPVVWTTFATGHFARQHGILDFVYPYQEGEQRPVDASLRLEPALWNLVDAKAGEPTVIGYYVSHPAEKIDGTIISDRAFSGLEQSVWPEELETLADEVRSSVYADRDKLHARFFPWDYDSAQADDQSSPYHTAARIVRGRIDNRILVEEFMRRMTLELIDEPGDLFITYFRLVDFVSHSSWYYFDPTDWDEKPDPSNVQLIGEMVPEAYRWTDEIIQAILQKHAGKANIVLVSDHGFGSGTGNYKSTNPLLSGNHRPNGVILAHGPDIEPGMMPQHPTIMEVFPTLAYLLDLPIADEVPGSIAYQMLDEAFTESRSPRFVAQYDFDWQPVAAAEVDEGSRQEEMEELRGLGYIGEGVELTGDSSGERLEFWESDPKLIVLSLHADVTYYLLKNDIKAANRVTNELKRHKPEMVSRLLSRVSSKIESFRRDVPDSEKLVPRLEAFVARHRQ